MSDKRWVALATALSELVEATGAENAVVADASEFLWCRGIAMNTYETIGVDRVWRLAMASASRPLEEGGRVALTRSEEQTLHGRAILRWHLSADRLVPQALRR